MLRSTMLAYAALAMLSANSSAAGEHRLQIVKIEMKKTPQSGTWRAGTSIRQESEKDNRDSWHGGEREFEGASAILPAEMELNGLDHGEKVVLFIGLDDDAEDAGGAKAEDQKEISFKVFGTGDKPKVFDYAEGDWSFRVHYTLTK